jgi:hypothetical protein
LVGVRSLTAGNGSPFWIDPAMAPRIGCMNRPRSTGSWTFRVANSSSPSHLRKGERRSGCARTAAVAMGVRPSDAIRPQTSFVFLVQQVGALPLSS